MNFGDWLRSPEMIDDCKQLLEKDFEYVTDYRNKKLFRNMWIWLEKWRCGRI